MLKFKKSKKMFDNFMFAILYFIYGKGGMVL